jgi:hypothetical protein
MAWRYATKAEIKAAAKKKKPVKQGGWTLVSASKGVNPKGKYTVGSGTTNASSGGYTGLTDEEIARRAGLSADASIAASSAAINRVRAAAAAAAQRDREAIAGLGAAQQGMLSGIPAQITGIRNEAGKAIASYGEGYSKEAGATIGQGQDTTAATVAEQGQPNAPTVDPGAVANAVYAQTGEIPATEQTQIGAASGMAAAGMPAVVARAAEEDIMQRMALAASEDAGYRQQLIDLAATRPGLVDDAMAKLYDIEQQKFGQFEADRRFKLDQQQLALQQRAQTANEKALGIKTTQANQRLDISSQSLTLREKKYASDLKAAEAKGQQIDAAASKVIGYVVDKNGQPVLNTAGGRIKVVQTGKQKANTVQANKQKATAEALKLKGSPVENKDPLSGEGRYIARPGLKGVLPARGNRPRTTNNPAYAQYDGSMTFAQAQSYIMSSYGLNRAQARAVLVAAGWKPGG